MQDLLSLRASQVVGTHRSDILYCIALFAVVRDGLLDGMFLDGFAKFGINKASLTSPSYLLSLKCHLDFIVCLCTAIHKKIRTVIVIDVFNHPLYPCVSPWFSIWLKSIENITLSNAGITTNRNELLSI